MYAQSIVDARIAIAEEALGYRLTYHDLDEIDEFTNRLDESTRLDNLGRPYFARDLTRYEYQFIENEKVLCACDAGYWLTHYAWLSDENTNAVRFTFRGAQTPLFHVISELEAKHAAIELLIAKGRQQYITTLTQLLVDHRVFFHHYTYGVTASADATKSAEMAQKTFFTYDHMPWWLKPKYSRRVEGVPGLLKFDTMESRLSILHGAASARAKGAQKTGIARGSTPTVYAISEVAHFPDAEQTIEAALFGGVHANPKILGCLESTFAGDNNWFARKYKGSQELIRAGKPTRLRPLFFNWPFAREIYPTPTWWETNRDLMPPDWRPTGKVAEQILKAELFIRSDELLASFMGVDWTMPIEQRWFYEYKYREAEQSGTMSTLMQEFPCDDVEAMVSSFDNVFGREVIELIDSNREKKFDVYGFVGQAIDQRFEPHPDEIDYTRPRTIFNHTTPRGQIYRWEMVPLKYELYKDAKGHETERDGIDCRLFVYKQPDLTRDYSIGTDTAKGNGGDASVVAVNLVGHPGSMSHPGTPDIQAAEFRSHYTSHVEASSFIMPIALMYLNKERGIFGWPKFAVEQIEGLGDVCQNELRKLGYPAGRFFNFGRYDEKEMKKQTNKLGWFTTGWSRNMLLGRFVHAVKNGWYVLNSPWTIDECNHFEVHVKESGKEKQEHSASSWDDGIFANAIAYFIVHDMDSVTAQSQRQYHGKEASYNLPEIMIDPNPTGMIVSTNGYRNTLRLEDIVRGGIR